jgi:hypothetical protein
MHGGIMRRIFMVGLLFVSISTPSLAELYGVSVSKVESTSVSSPNKEWSVSVKINKENLPMLTIQKEPGGHPAELLPVQASGWVLWSTDSKTFAFTDRTFADHYSVHLCGVEPEGVQCRDISSEIEGRVKKRLTAKTEIDKLYSKALKWHSPNTLIVGVHMITSPTMKPGQTDTPVSYSFRAFWVNGGTGHITKELTKKQAYHELSMGLDQLEW